MKRNKNLVLFLLLIFVFLTGLSSECIFATEHPILINKIYYLLRVKKGKVIVVRRDGEDREESEDEIRLKIPEYISYDGEKHRVTNIADEAFYGDSELNEVSFEGYIDKIGDRAFDRTNLTFIDMHHGVGEFGENAFLRIPSEARFVVPIGKAEEYAYKLRKEDEFSNGQFIETDREMVMAEDFARSYF